MAKPRAAKSANGILVLILVVIVMIAVLPSELWITLAVLGAITVVIWLGISSKKPPAALPNKRATLPRLQARIERTATRDHEAPRSVLQGRAVPPRWVPPGQPVEVAGIKIPGGMLYFGSDLRSPDGEVDPALIEPRLPVLNAPVDLSVRQMGYWPSYSTIDPGSRRAYLDWLAGGRQNPTADVGYVFLFFYGLERRALIDAATDPTARAELDSMRVEVERLLGIYGENRSFRGYANQFLEYLRAQRPGNQVPKDPPPLPSRREMTLSLRVGLGQMAASGLPVPPDWAFLWVSSDPAISSPKALQRCPTEFKRLFIHQYTSQFGDGLKLPQNRTKLRVVYQPASGGFARREYPVDVGDIPDVTAVVAPAKKMQAMVDDCATALAPYSRFLRKNPSGLTSFEHILLLPLPLWPEAAQSGILDLNRRVATEAIEVTLEELASSCGSTKAIERDGLRALAKVLESLDVGIEPDVLSGARAPKPDEPIVLFRKELEVGLPNEPGYHAASAMLDLGCAVAMADGHASDGEIHLLTKQVDGWASLTNAQHARLRARMRRGLAAPPSLASVKKRFEPIPFEARRALAHLMSTLAQADGVVVPVEVKLLEKTYKALGFETQAAYDDLHSVAAGSSIPVESRTGPAIASPRPDRGFTLDAARIQALQKETEQVSALLATVFVEEATVIIEEAEEQEEVTLVEEAGQLGLDPEHTAFLRLLISRPVWSRQELADAAADMELMLDGTLERINEASLDVLKQPLIEGDDPIEVSREALEAMPE